MKDWKDILLEQIIRENLLEQSDDTAVDLGNESVKIVQPHWIRDPNYGIGKLNRVKRRIGESGKIGDGFTIASKTELSDDQAIDFIEKNYERKQDWLIWIDNSRKIGTTYQRDVIVTLQQQSDIYKELLKVRKETDVLKNEINMLYTRHKLDSLIYKADRVYNKISDDVKRKLILPDLYQYRYNDPEVSWEIFRLQYNNNSLPRYVDGQPNQVEDPVIGFNEYPELKEIIIEYVKHGSDDVVFLSGIHSIQTKSKWDEIIKTSREDYNKTLKARKQWDMYQKLLPGKVDKINNAALNRFKTTEWGSLETTDVVLYKLTGNSDNIFYKDRADWYQIGFNNYFNWLFYKDNAVKQIKVTDDKILTQLNSPESKQIRTNYVQESIKSNPIQFNESSDRMRYIHKLLEPSADAGLKAGNQWAVTLKDVILKYKKEYKGNPSVYGTNCSLLLFGIGYILKEEQQIDESVLNNILELAKYYQVTTLTESVRINEQGPPVNIDSNRVQIINDKIQANEKYFNGLVKAGDEAVKKKDWKTAKTNYELALRIDASDTSVKKKLDAVNAKLKQPEPVPEPPKPKPEEKPKPEDTNKTDINISTSGLTPAAKHCLYYILSLKDKFGRDKWGTIGKIAHRKIANSNETSQHAYGNALDWHGKKGVGDPVMQQLADYLVANYEKLNVRNVIYNRQIWNRFKKKWDGYTNDPHTDHVHVDFDPKYPVDVVPAKDRRDKIEKTINDIDYIFREHPEKYFKQFKGVHWWNDDNEAGAVKKAKKWWDSRNTELKTLEVGASKPDLYNIKVTRLVMNKIIDAINSGDSYEASHPIYLFKNNKYQKGLWKIKWDYM